MAVKVFINSDNTATFNVLAMNRIRLFDFLRFH